MKRISLHIIARRNRKTQLQGQTLSLNLSHPESTNRPRVVIVGAGFGGMAAARALRGNAAEVTLIDQTNHHLFQPLLYQVATAALSPSDIATATRVLMRGGSNLSVLMAEVTGVDIRARSVLLRDGHRLPYDYLVLATGSASSFFGPVSYTHLRAHETPEPSRMPSSA